MYIERGVLCGIEEIGRDELIIGDQKPKNMHESGHRLRRFFVKTLSAWLDIDFALAEQLADEEMQLNQVIGQVADHFPKMLHPQKLGDEFKTRPEAMDADWVEIVDTAANLKKFKVIFTPGMRELNRVDDATAGQSNTETRALDC